MCCQVCGSILEVRTYDYGTCRETGYRDAGEYLYCDECRQARDEGDVLEEGPEAEALREKREEEIGERQHEVWLIGHDMTRPADGLRAATDRTAPTDEAKP